MNRHFSNFRTAAMCLTLAFAAFSCSDDDNFPDAPPTTDVNGGNTIPDLSLNNSLSDVVSASNANGTPDGFDSLALALKLSGMDRSPLDFAGDFTLFAPTNQAFASYLTANNLVRLSQISTSDLSAILSYHLVKGNVGLSGAQYQIIRSAGNQNFTLKTSPQPEINAIGSDSIMVNAAGFQTADNGRLYPVNKLLIPNLSPVVPSLTLSQLVASKGLVYFDSALKFAGVRFGDSLMTIVTFSVKDSLNSTKTQNVTLFAPTNAAFQQYMAAKGYSSFQPFAPGGIPTAVLRNYVYNHIARPRANSNILYDGQSLSASKGQLNITRNGADVFVQQQPDSANFAPAKLQTTNSNILATNGILHIIEGPLSDN